MKNNLVVNDDESFWSSVSDKYEDIVYSYENDYGISAIDGIEIVASLGYETKSIPIIPGSKTLLISNFGFRDKLPAISRLKVDANAVLGVSPMS